MTPLQIDATVVRKLRTYMLTWAAATALQAARVRERSIERLPTAHPRPGLTDLAAESSLFIVAAAATATAARAIEKQLSTEPNKVREAIDTFVGDTPHYRNARNVTMHVDQYIAGTGNLQGGTGFLTQPFATTATLRADGELELDVTFTFVLGADPSQVLHVPLTKTAAATEQLRHDVDAEVDRLYP